MNKSANLVDYSILLFESGKTNKKKSGKKKRIARQWVYTVSDLFTRNGFNVCMGSKR